MGIFSRVPAAAKAVKPRLYQTIDRSTNEFLSAPNHALLADVVNTINQAPDPTYASTKACQRLALRLRTQSLKVQSLALQTLEACVRGCGQYFHTTLAKSELLGHLGRMADRSVWCSTPMQAQTLTLIQEWAYAPLPQPEFSALYNRLKARNLPFPPRDGAATQQFTPYPGLTPPPPGQAATSPGGSQGTPGRHPPGGMAPGPHVSRAAANLGPDFLAPGRSPQQLASDLTTARGNLTVLTELLDGVQSTPGAAKQDHVSEVAGVVAASKDRIMNLLGSGAITDESTVAIALEVNDESQRALDRRAQMIAAADGQPPAPAVSPPGAARVTVQPAATPVALKQPPGGAGPAEGSAASPPGAAAPSPPPAPPAPLMDLLDLDWAPPPPPAAGTEANGGVQDSPAASAPSPTPSFFPPPQQEWLNAPSNNPFAPKPASAAAPAPAAAAYASSPTPALSPQSSFPDASFAPAAVTSSPSPAVPSPAGSDAPGALNPFLSDAAFSTVHSTGLPPAAPPAPKATGNPFATAAGPAAPPPPPALVSQGSFQRPAPLVIPPDSGAAATTAYQASPSPYGCVPTPAYPTPQAAMTPSHSGQFPPQQQYPAQYPAIYGTAPQWTPAQAPPAAFPGAPSPYPFTAVPGGQAAARAGGISDAFGDLVSLTPKREEPPPPPKGTPMRGAGGSSGALGSPSTLSGGSTPKAAPNGTHPPAPLAQTSPPRAAAPPPAPVAQADSSALSAFDAFDSLASAR